MSAINSMSELTASDVNTTDEQVKSLDEIASSSEKEFNLMFMLMYEEWKQKILLSDGLDENDKIEW